MADPNDFLQLPPGFDSPDPVDGNPFPEGDVRHRFWARATLEAEEEACRSHSDALLRGRPKTLEKIVPWDVMFFTSRYDIWAKRGVRVVLAREMIAPWDQWLANYANATLTTYNAFNPPDEALRQLRDALVGRREYWKAEGRRNVALQEARQTQVAASKSEAGVSQPSPGVVETIVNVKDFVPPEVTDATGPRAQVDHFIETVGTATGRRITRTDIWRVAGYTEATQFERFQKNSRASAGSITKFNRILQLEPAEFLERLGKLTVPK